MITIRDLHVRFDEHAVFDGFCCNIPLDGNTVLRGASGSGKTTLLRLMAGLSAPDGGTIDGLAGLKASIVFQEDRLLNWYTALENVALVAEKSHAAALLQSLGLGDYLHERPAALSGGMKRRVAIARALAFGGDLMLLDEPFSGLDDTAKICAANALLHAAIPLIAAVHSDEESALLRPKMILTI